VKSPVRLESRPVHRLVNHIRPRIDAQIATGVGASGSDVDGSSRHATLVTYHRRIGGRFSAEVVTM
jgi:hypothetical protein